MKNLVTITGAPASAPMVVKEVALQLGKIALFWTGSYIIHKVAYSAILNNDNKPLIPPVK